MREQVRRPTWRLVATILVGLTACAGAWFVATEYGPGDASTSHVSPALSETRSEPGSHSRPVNIDYVYPTGSLTDVVSWADEVIVATVVGGSLADAEEDPQVRSLTFRVDEVLWRRWEGAPVVPEGDTVEMLTYGDAVINGESVRFTPAGEVAFEVGTTYIVPIFWHRDRFSPMAEASFEVTGTSQIVVGDQRGEYVAGLTGSSTSDFQELLLATDPYPAPREVLESDWRSRVQAFRHGDFGPAE